MKFTVTRTAESVKESGGDSGYINKSGIYDVVINYVQVAETKNGAYQLNFNVNNGGMDQTIYGPYLVNKDGKMNEITQRLLDRLCTVAGMENNQELETEEVTVPMGKDKKPTDIHIFPELSELSVKMRIQMEYSLYNDNIQERRNIRAFYREDGATAAEIETGEGIGKRIALDEEKYASNVTYKDGLTEEDVAAWIKERIESASNKADTPKAKTTAKRPLFGKTA